MSARVTIADVAQRAGVSIATVSRAFNQPEKLSPETLAKVRLAVNQLGYHPNAAARSLAANRTHIVSLALYELEGDYLQYMLRGLEDAASSSGYNLLIHATRHTPSPLPSLGRHNSDGVIVFADAVSELTLRQWHDEGFPVVLMHRASPPNLNLPSVQVENVSGARALVDHLIERCGRRRIAYLRGPVEHQDSYWRELGYRESLAAHDLAIDRALIGSGEFEVEDSYRAVQEWLRARLDFDAIFAANDESAMGALLALREAGACVPDDVAVVGFDDIRAAAHLNPPLTTARSPIEEVGRQSVYQLLRLIGGEPLEPQIMLPTELIIRESCGAYKRKSGCGSR
jgi:DNA-binding LacI/PurR family transcriptional regulator